MKKLLATLVMVLGVAGAAGAEENEFVHDILVLSPVDEEADVAEMRAALKTLAPRLESPAVLGELAGKVKVERRSTLDLCDHVYSLADYPQLSAYKQAVREQWTALRQLRRSPEFAQAGLRSQPGRKWQQTNNALEEQYESIQLPFGFFNAFTDMNVLAGQYSRLRLGSFENVGQLASWEDETAAVQNRIHDTLNWLLIDE